ncbi:hypothetical protein E2C01_095054 [Portunus trituberculatus]|uniref:Uncharacterized protein n=1 Tax=Portunus trituberculatus TaxID=210409 RepID=A0A5B7K2J9_PORTR|nr:hypothetical protein [Portunus trituberculatus]
MEFILRLHDQGRALRIWSKFNAGIVCEGKAGRKEGRKPGKGGENNCERKAR